MHTELPPSLYWLSSQRQRLTRKPISGHDSYREIALSWEQPWSCGCHKKQSQTKENNNPNQKSDDNNQEVAFVVKGMGGGDVSEFV